MRPMQRELVFVAHVAVRPSWLLFVIVTSCIPFVCRNDTLRQMHIWFSRPTVIASSGGGRRRGVCHYGSPCPFFLCRFSGLRRKVFYRGGRLAPSSAGRTRACRYGGLQSARLLLRPSASAGSGGELQWNSLSVPQSNTPPASPTGKRICCRDLLAYRAALRMQIYSRRQRAPSAVKGPHQFRTKNKAASLRRDMEYKARGIRLQSWKNAYATPRRKRKKADPSLNGADGILKVPSLCIVRNERLNLSSRSFALAEVPRRTGQFNAGLGQFTFDIC